MEKDEFIKEVEKRVLKLSNWSQVNFAWKCAVRAFPFLGAYGKFNFWKQEDVEKNLIAIVDVLDITYTYIDKISRASFFASAADPSDMDSPADAAAAYGGYLDCVEFATIAAKKASEKLEILDEILDSTDVPYASFVIESIVSVATFVAKDEIKINDPTRSDYNSKSSESGFSDAENIAIDFAISKMLDQLDNETSTIDNSKVIDETIQITNLAPNNRIDFTSKSDENLNFSQSEINNGHNLAIKAVTALVNAEMLFPDVDLKSVIFSDIKSYSDDKSFLDKESILLYRGIWQNFKEALKQNGSECWKEYVKEKM